MATLTQQLERQLNDTWHIQDNQYVTYGDYRRLLAFIQSLTIGSSTVSSVSKSTGDFSGNNVTVAQLSGKTADSGFYVFSGGVMLSQGVDYTFSGTTITVASGPTDLRILIFS